MPNLGVADCELTLDDFYRTALPSLPPALATKLDDIFTALTTGDEPAYSTKDSWWNDFVFTPHRNEDTTYEAFSKIADSVVAAVQGVVKPCPEQFFSFVHMPDCAPKSLSRPTKHGPGGYFIRKRKEAKGEEHHWIDIGPTGEYNLHNSPSSRDDNTRKAVWNASHTMREDVRRRRSWAFTVERATLRVWYFDRSVVIVSQAFNIMKNPKNLLHFFLAFLYSEERSVGWDPSIRRVWEPLAVYPTAVHGDHADSTLPTDGPSSDESDSVYAEDSEESSSEDAHGDRWKAWKDARRARCTQATHSSDSRHMKTARSTKPGLHMQAGFEEVVSEGRDCVLAAMQGRTKARSRLAVKGEAETFLRPQYIIDIHGTDGSVHHFKTVKVLSNVGAEVMHSRGTRVWQAVRCHDAAGTEIADDGRLYVVKDCWIDQDRAMEGDTIHNILQRARSYHEQSKLTDAQVSILERGLLTVCTHGRTDPSNQTSITLDVGVLDSYSPHHVRERDNPKAAQKQQDYHMKFNYRIAFKEVCMPLYKEIWLDQVFAHLSRVIEVLEILHCVGWVHRDISPGNILILCSDTGGNSDSDYCVKLSDLEYAQDMFAPDSRAHNTRTGTLDFMSIEVASQEGPTWCFPSELPMQSIRDTPDPSLSSLSDGPQVQLPAWFYHPLNEMESVLWLGFFFTVNKGLVFREKDKSSFEIFLESWVGIVSPTGMPIDKHRIDQQHKLACSLFRKPRDGRPAFISMSSPTRSLYLSPVVGGLIQKGLHECRIELVAQYRLQEQNIPGIDHTSAAALYSGWRQSFNILARAVGKLEARVELRDLSDAQNEAEEYWRTTTSDGKGLTAQMDRLTLHGRTV